MNCSLHNRKLKKRVRLNRNIYRQFFFFFIVEKYHATFSYIYILENLQPCAQIYSQFSLNEIRTSFSLHTPRMFYTINIIYIRLKWHNWIKFKWNLFVKLAVTKWIFFLMVLNMLKGQQIVCYAGRAVVVVVYLCYVNESNPVIA